MHAEATAELPKLATRFLDHLAVERGASKNTLNSYRRDLEEFFKNQVELTQEAVTQHLVELRKQGLAETSIARKISTLRSMEDFLAREDGSRPGWRIDLKSRGRKLPKSLPYDAIKRLIESPDQSISGIRDRAILEALYASGMRVSECMGLDVDAFVSDPQGVHFFRVTGKGGKERLVPIGEVAGRCCTDYLIRSRPTLAKDPQVRALFLNGRGGRLSRQAVWQLIKNAAKRAGITGEVTPHTLRHAFATHMLERGADVRSVQELLGHSSVVTTQIYTMVTNENLRETHALSHPRAK